MATDWESEVRGALGALAGKIVSEVWVQEMAFYGPDSAGHFTHPNLHFVQANVLELRTSNSDVYHFSCAQNDDTWTIWPRLAPADQHLSSDAGEGTFRTRGMSEFPVGEIGEVLTDDETAGSIQEIRITIGDQQIFLRAGEVYENVDGTLTVCDRDESVLIFLGREAYSETTFNQPIYKQFYQ